MKRALLSLCTIVMGATASASIYDTNYQPGYNYGLDSNALAVCQNISNFSKNDCLQAIVGKGFSQKALNVCSSISVYAESQKISCLSEIGNKAYQGDAVSVCQGISDFNKIECLKAIQNRRFVPEAVQVCKNMSIYNESNKIECLKNIAEKTYSPSAINFCSTISDFNRNDCLKSIAGNYYQDKAIEVCSRISIYQESDKLFCVSLIANKIYDSRLLGFCSDAGFRTLACLRGLPGNVTALPRFSPRQRTDLDIVLDVLDYVISGQQSGGVIVVQERPTLRPPVIVVQPAPVNKCVIKQTGQVVPTEQFYQIARETARTNKEQKCVDARLANTDRSSTLIDETGRVIGSNLTREGLREVKRTSRLAGHGCIELVCDDAAR